MSPSDRIVTLGDMLELNASAFLGAATYIARVHTIFSSMHEHNDENLAADNAKWIRESIESFLLEAEKIGAKLAAIHARRFIAQLEQEPCPLTVRQAVNMLSEVESRFADFLYEIRMFALTSLEAPFMEPADSLIEIDGFSSAFPDSSFEIEEAAKCVALGRYTASVFHAMRMLELGIRALSKRLSIPDPTKPAERNWSVILKALKEKIDELWPPKTRLGGSEGAAFDELYAHLEAVRNPWRNATMHVETIYAPHEALHIIRCSAFFMRRLSELSDENGNPPPSPTLPEPVGS